MLHGHSDWDSRSYFVGLVQVLSTAHSWLHDLEEGSEAGRRSGAWTRVNGDEKEGRQERRDLVSLPGARQAPCKQLS